MARILADLPDEGVKWLDRRAVDQGTSRDAVFSMIIRWYRQHIESHQ